MAMIFNNDDYNQPDDYDYDIVRERLYSDEDPVTYAIYNDY